MKILVACEFSGVVSSAFDAMGHDVWSCDILPSTRKKHIQCDVRAMLNGGWDMMIAHPPCTYLARSGARWWTDRQSEQSEALDLVQTLLDAPIHKICIENPPGAIGSRIKQATQYIQPYEHGHPEKKLTGLWLKGLPNLVASNDVYLEMIALPKRLQNRIHYLPPSKDRGLLRSITPIGIAQAMANQWG